MSIKEWNGTGVRKLHFNSTARLIIIIVTVDNSSVLCGGFLFHDTCHHHLIAVQFGEQQSKDTIQLEAIKWLDCIFSGCPINVP